MRRNHKRYECIKPENDKNTITRLNLEPGWFTRFSCWCNHHNLLKLESSAKQLASSLITQSDALRRCHLRLPRARPLSWTSIVRQSAASTARHYKRYSDAKQCARFWMNPNDVFLYIYRLHHVSFRSWSISERPVAVVLPLENTFRPIKE